MYFILIKSTYSWKTNNRDPRIFGSGKVDGTYTTSYHQKIPPAGGTRIPPAGGMWVPPVTGAGGSWLPPVPIAGGT